MTTDRLLVVGIGNDLLGDDAAGLLAASALADEGFPVQATMRSGLALLDTVVGFRRVLLIDSQVSGRLPGSIDEFTLTPSVVRSPSAHYLGYGETLTIGAAVGLELPEEIRVLAVERTPEVWVGADLSEPVRVALPALVERARTIVHEWKRSPGGAPVPLLPVGRDQRRNEEHRQAQHDQAQHDA